MSTLTNRLTGIGVLLGLLAFAIGIEGATHGVFVSPNYPYGTPLFPVLVYQISAVVLLGGLGIAGVIAICGLVLSAIRAIITGELE